MLVLAASGGYVPAAIVAAIGTVAVSAITIFFQQRDRRRDGAIAVIETSNITKIEENKLQLQSWQGLIDSALATVASVSDQLKVVRERLRNCEEIEIPALQAEIASLRAKLEEQRKNLSTARRRITLLTKGH